MQYKLKKLYNIGFYYLDDKYETVRNYSVVAYTEKQAKFFLSNYINSKLTESLKQAYYFSYNCDNRIAIICSKIEKIIKLEKQEKFKIGEII